MPPRRSTREKKTVAEVEAEAAASAAAASKKASSKPAEKKKEKASAAKAAKTTGKRKRDEDDDGEEAEADAAAPEDEGDNDDDAAGEDDGAADNSLGTAAEATAALEAVKAEGPAKPAKSWHGAERLKLAEQHRHTVAFLTEKVAILTKLEAGEAVDRSHPLFVDPRTLSAPQLQDQMRLWGLVSSGARTELVKRYKHFVESGKAQNKRKKKRAVDSFDPKIEKNDPYYRHKAYISSLYNN